MAGVDFNIEVRGADVVAAAFGRAPAMAKREMFAATWEAEFLLQREVQEITPVGVSGGSGLRASISAQEPKILADNVIGEVSSSAAHVVPVELGTKPHMPPIDPIIDWVVHKLHKSPDEAEGVARRIAWKIHHHGTKGAGMFGKTFEAQGNQVRRILQRGVDRIAENLAKGAE